jgi:2-hydroxychromene-2-carboxylate isomerase
MQEQDSHNNKMTSISNNGIIYYFWTISDWAYFGGPRLDQLAKRFGLSVDYRPVNLPNVYSRTGGILLGERSKQRQDYRIAELERWRTKLGMPLNIAPKYFPVDQDPSSCLIVAAKRSGLDVAPLTNAIMRAIWAEERDISDEETLRDIGRALVPDIDALIALSKGTSIRVEYESYTERAPSDGVFGSPFYLYDGQGFWGQDRLDFLAELVEQRIVGSEETRRSG